MAGISQNWVGVRGVTGSSNAAISAQNTGNGPGIYATSAGGPAAVFAGIARTEVLQITGGSDLAERFQVSDGATAEPGTVMVIDPDNPGHLMISTAAYDRKVAGVISGAGDVATGLVLHQEGVLEGDAVVAIGGQRLCQGRSAFRANLARRPADDFGHGRLCNGCDRLRRGPRRDHRQGYVRIGQRYRTGAGAG